ncbi:hypothetical protein ANN_05230 [Periplaneta americana]|uniref:Uncharacterized protein n=1 Tax=Periplaneta americana TaxID=6978 RepID=A0ABQ8TCE1_PERAM|nr:hypothetical protein ANN_05230 [Periplaneta americana]
MNGTEKNSLRHRDLNLGFQLYVLTLYPLSHTGFPFRCRIESSQFKFHLLGSLGMGIRCGLVDRASARRAENPGSNPGAGENFSPFHSTEVSFPKLGSIDRPRRANSLATRSPDMNPLDFYLWGRLKSLMYTSAVPNVEVLQQRIEHACGIVRNELNGLCNVQRSLRRRAQLGLQKQQQQPQQQQPPPQEQ